MLTVEHDVHSQIAHLHGLADAAGHAKNLRPVRHLKAEYLFTGIRMAVREAPTPRGPVNDTGDQVETGADRTLVQVGPAIGLSGRQPQHGQGRRLLVNEHADIGRALKADTLEGGTGLRLSARRVTHWRGFAVGTTAVGSGVPA